MRKGATAKADISAEFDYKHSDGTRGPPRGSTPASVAETPAFTTS